MIRPFNIIKTGNIIMTQQILGGFPTRRLAHNYSPDDVELQPAPKSEAKS